MLKLNTCNIKKHNVETELRLRGVIHIWYYKKYKIKNKKEESRTQFLSPIHID